MAELVLGVTDEEAKKYGLKLHERHLLGRVRFLAPTSSVVRNGRSWLVWPVEKWAEMLAVSPRTVKRAFKKLKTAGLVETRLGRFGDRTQLFLKERGQNGPSQRMRETEKEKNMGGKKLDEKVRPKTVDDVVPFLSMKSAARGLSVHSSAMAKLTTCTQLEQAWKQAWSETQPAFCPSWSAKDRGMATTLLKKCSEANVHPVGVIRVAVQHWDALTAYAKGKEGAFPLPAVPSLGWCVKYANSLVWFFMEKFGEVDKSVEVDTADEVVSAPTKKPKMQFGKKV